MLNNQFLIQHLYILKIIFENQSTETTGKCFLILLCFLQMLLFKCLVDDLLTLSSSYSHLLLHILENKELFLKTVTKQCINLSLAHNLKTTILQKRKKINEKEKKQMVNDESPKRKKHLFENSFSIIYYLGWSILIWKHNVPPLWTQCNTKQLSHHVHTCLHHHTPIHTHIMWITKTNY